MIKKNDVITADVIDLTVNGDGVVKSDSYPIFVPGAVPGDLVRLKVTKTNKTYGFGKLIEIVTPSSDRRAPACSSFSDCGGCSLMHFDYEAQLKYKSDFVLSNLVRIGGCREGEFVYEPIVGADSEYFYRNKAQFPVGMAGGKAVCGFYLPKSHTISPCESCHIQDERINAAVGYVMDYIRKEKIPVYDEKAHRGIVRHIYVRCGEGSIMVAIVTNSTKPLRNIKTLVTKLSALGEVSLLQNINTKRTNVILGDKNIILSGKDHIFISLGELRFKVSLHSFFQVNTAQMKKLYAKALEYAAPTSDDTVFDLYCGVGSISLYMARSAKRVVGVEIVPDAIVNAKENAKINNIDNAHFYCGDCTEVTEKLLAGGERADIAVVDPPRKGCDERLLELLKNMNPRKIVYVSCNSATLARDAAVLREFGYELTEGCAVDMFPQSGHVETVVLLQRQNT